MAKLWTQGSPEFVIPGLPDAAGTGRWKAPGMRMVFWPNQQVCWQVNIYLMSMRISGLAVSTVNTYASEMSVFVQHLFNERGSMEAVTDDTLVEFSDWLLSRGISSGNHVNRLIRRVIAFLQWFQNSVTGPGLVGLQGDGAQVTVTTRSSYVPRRGIQSISHHSSMVPRSVPRTVRPSSMQVLTKLLNAVETNAKTSFRKNRDGALILLLADAGLRREEVTWVTVEKVRAAQTNGGRLRVRTSKRRGHPEREIPLPELTLEKLGEFLDVYRPIQIRAIRKRNRAFADNGWMFCTRTGGKMSPATVSQMFSDLRAVSGIPERAFAHMLRHRYITLQVLNRLRRLSRNGAPGVEALTTILSQVSSLSGHSSLESLWEYVDWAYELLAHEREDSQQRDDLAQARDIVGELLDALGPDGEEQLKAALISVKGALERASKNDPLTRSVVGHSIRERASRSRNPDASN